MFIKKNGELMYSVEDSVWPFWRSIRRPFY